MHEEEEAVEDDSEETRELVPICSLTDAKKHLEEIRRYFESYAHTTDKDF